MITKEQIKEAVTNSILYIGDDPEREGLKLTPDRVLLSYEELFSGYEWTDDTIRNMMTQFDNVELYDELIILKQIEFYSTCEHHFLPFVGMASIGYIPDKKIVGISKLARLLEVYSRRLQVQERICQEVTQDIMTYLSPLGAGCVLKASHLCISCRGVQKQNSEMVTASMTGCFKTDFNTRQEFLNLIKG